MQTQGSLWTLLHEMNQRESIGMTHLRWFHDRLEVDDYIVDPQVRVSGWRIDLGIMHEDFPDGYLCGVKLDGKDHLRLRARDRDIERQAILESKGWKILRI